MTWETLIWEDISLTNQMVHRTTGNPVESFILYIKILCWDHGYPAGLNGWSTIDERHPHMSPRQLHGDWSYAGQCQHSFAKSLTDEWRKSINQPCQIPGTTGPPTSWPLLGTVVSQTDCHHHHYHQRERERDGHVPYIVHDEMGEYTRARIHVESCRCHA